ncbi:MAG: AzlD domain-containing protein [Clostridia bacterium]|nr:AzlD domain-containing protein [Clostridia bacterium]
MNFLLLSVFMMLVTFIPRILPGFLLDKVRLGPRATKFLNLIPYTAMASLIFPGVLSVDVERIWIGALGAIIAIVLSLFKKIPTAVVVIASVLALVGIYAII